MSILHSFIRTNPLAGADADLLSRCKEGDQEAWETLIHKYRNLIYSIPIRMGISQEDANEIFQEACLTLLSELHHIREPKTLPAWLIKVTMHKCSRYRRSAARFPLNGKELILQQAVSGDVPDDMVLELQQVQMLRVAISELAERCRNLIERLFLTTPAEPYESVAKALGIATGSIGFTRMRCLGRLRRLLEEKGFQ